MHRVWLVALLAITAGCLGNGDPSPGDGAGDDINGAPGTGETPAWPDVGPCPATLHVWVVPVDELAELTPPEFPPTAIQAEGQDTPVGRIVFYLYDCPALDGGGGPELLGLLGVRVHAPDGVAPPAGQPDWAVTPWVSIYALGAFGEGSLAGVVAAAGLPLTNATGEVVVTPTPAPDAPTANARIELEDGSVLEGAMAGAPTRVESFDRPERYYHLVPGPDREVRWLDVQFNMTLWETEGTADYSDGSPWDQAVRNRGYDAAVDHHAMEATLDLTAGRGHLAPR